MVDLSNYDFTSITDKTVKQEEYFINSYVNECIEYEIAMSWIRRMCIIIDAKYKKSYLNTFMAKECQHLNAPELYILLTL